MAKKENLSLPIIHTLIMIAAWLSPFWLDWKLIFICLALYFIQMIIFKGCVLTNWQVSGKIGKENDLTMYSFWLERMGYKVNRLRLRFYSRWIMPFIILIITILWQITFKIQVPVKF